MQFETFEQVISYMEHFTNLEKDTGKKGLYNKRTYRLDRMSAILKTLDNPQESFKSIHVAGSKGKGSTASYIANGIQALGYKTGLYLSPHVSDYRERFSLCGKFFEDRILIEVGNLLADKMQNFCFCNEEGENIPTTFELYTAFAFLLFKYAHCDFAVIETGLGGRLDATNVINPIASVLTPIELEHTEILGDTIEKIAVEKSKIIKKNTPSFISFQKEDAMKVFEKEAKTQNSEIFELKDKLESLDTVSTENGQKTHIEFTDGFSADLILKMEGKVQAQNCAVALLVLRTLNLYRKQITEKALENTSLPGRMEKINWKNPLFIDGAHTPQSMKSLLETFRILYPGKTGTCIFGCAKGKDFKTMGDLILENFDRIAVARPGTFKKSNPKEIFDYLKSKAPEKNIELKEEAKDALDFSLKDNGPVLVCGSFYLAGEIKEALCL